MRPTLAVAATFYKFVGIHLKFKKQNGIIQNREIFRVHKRKTFPT